MTTSLRATTSATITVVVAGLVAGLLAIVGAQTTPLIAIATLAGLAVTVLAFVRPIATVYLAVLLIPLEALSIHAGKSFVLTPAKFVALAAAAGWLVRRLVDGRGTVLTGSLRSPLTLPLLFLLAVHVPGLFLAEDRYAVVKELVVWSAWYILFLAMLADRGRSTTNTLVAVIAAAGGIVAAIAVVQTAGTSQMAFQAAGQITNRAAGSFTSPVALGIFVTVIVPLQVVLTFRGRSQLLRLSCSLATLLSLLALTLALTRGAFLALTVAGTWLVVSWRPARRPALIIFAVLSVLVLTRFNPAPSVINTNVLTQRITSINSQTYTAQLRLRLWRVVPKMVANNFPFGIGAKNFPVQAAAYGLVFPEGAPSNAHNTFLVIASEFGVPGVIALVWLVLALSGSVVRSMRYLEEPGRSLAVGLTASFIALLVDGTTDYSYGEDSFLLTVMLLFAVAARLERSARARQPLVETADATARMLGPA